MVNTEYISISIATVSAIFAVYFGLKNQRLEKKNTDLQKRLLEIEEAKERDRKKTASKAQLLARIQKVNELNYRLLVENTGDCEARSIELNMDGEPFDEHRAAVRGEGKIRCIGPHSQVTRLLGLTLTCQPPFEFEAVWEDDSGEKGQYRTTLTF